MAPIAFRREVNDASKPVLLWKRIEWTTRLPGDPHFAFTGSTVLFEKLTVTQIVTKLSAFYGTQFSIALTTALQQDPFSSQMNPIHTTPSLLL